MYNNKFNTNDRILDLEQVIITLLPTGSGFDGKWNLDQLKNGNIECKNFYTCYTENGMVDSYADFTLTIKIVNCELHVLKFTFNGRHSQYLAKKYDLKNYFDDLFFDVGNMQASMLYNNCSNDFNLSNFL